ncbi:hypothetical protein TrCOL_g12996 [Triparma columacea]|uniref:Uncharacterized protein n=1 Tax=Triparma columacea TaxID=722753 RepID=A0A9W7GB73_9STRA|nr:hypothetical protein TrCOL_g12996 [Triparma columacea]
MDRGNGGRGRRGLTRPPCRRHYVNPGGWGGEVGGVKASTTRLRSMSEGEGEALYRDYVVKEKRGLVWGEGGITVAAGHEGDGVRWRSWRLSRGGRRGWGGST